MPNSPKYLIDTNVFIGLEDPGLTSPQFAALVAVAARHDVPIFIHDAAQDDINRDRDPSRREASLSKLAKFRRLSRVRGLSTEQLAGSYGRLKKPNDIVDATLLHALDIGAADFLVTQDHGIHERAARFASHLSGQILYVADALSLLRTTFEPHDVPLRYVEEVDAHQIPATDPIFDGLRDDYPGFDIWWREKCVRAMRRCWIVNDNHRVAGLVVRKDEVAGETDARLPGLKILKICTFKVSPERRGIKLGELLLRKVLWFCQANRYDVVYLTTFPDQSVLIDLLTFYGFRHTYSKADGERVYEKPLSGLIIEKVEEAGRLFEADRKAYPRFYAGRGVPVLGVPIRDEFHRVLFPDIDENLQYNLFAGGPQLPGNTIRKVYLCRAKKGDVVPGSILLFYKGKSGSGISQAITSVGIAESLTLAHSTEQLRRLAGGRSVYSEHQLRAFHASIHRPVKVINFLLVAHLAEPMHLMELFALGVFKRHPAQSIFSIAEEARDRTLDRLSLPMQAARAEIAQ